jgi:hypothetical protein
MKVDMREPPLSLWEVVAVPIRGGVMSRYYPLLVRILIPDVRNPIAPVRRSRIPNGGVFLF